MRHFIYLLLAVMTLTACGTTKKVDSTQKNLVRDSVNIRDSIVIKDSVVIRYEVNVRDSVSVRDSTVLVIDQNGNVVSKEKYRNTERNRDTDKNGTVAKSQKETNVQKSDERHDKDNESKSETTKYDKIDRTIDWFFFIWLSVMVLLSIINGIHKNKKA